MTSTTRIVTVALATAVGVAGLKVIVTAQNGPDVPAAHVLLLSVDGLHGFDLERFIANNPQSTLARLSEHGRTYTNASATRPSDSFPGLLAMVTGGTPRSTGVYYDDGYDRSLAPASRCSRRQRRDSADRVRCSLACGWCSEQFNAF